MLRGAAFDGPETVIRAAVKRTKGIVLKASSSEACAGFPRDLGNDFAGSGINLGLGQSLFARLQGNRNPDRFLSFRYASAFIDVEHADIGDEHALGRGRSFHNVGGLDALISQESEVALHRHKFGKFELRFGLCGPQFRRRYVIENELDCSSWRLGAHGFEGAGMELPEGAYDIFWP